MSTAIRELRDLLTQELGRVVIGVEASVDALVIALIARGHVLVQGVPGLGKTLFAKALARALGGEFKRIQGTADLMPSDIIGVHIFDEAARNFAFRPGPLFADVVLVDEINRAGPKTQSALLEAMEERQVSVERSVLPLPADFIVLARAAAENIHVSEALSGYLLDLAAATREHPRLALGLSTRGVLALLKAARVVAGMRASDFVTPDDVKQVAPWVLAHRLVVTPEATLEGVGDAQLVQSLLTSTPVPR